MLSDSYAEKGAGAVYVDKTGTLVVEASMFRENAAGDNAGAIFVEGPGSTYLNNCVLSNNTAGFIGGALHIGERASAEVRTCAFSDNAAGHAENEIGHGGAHHGGAVFVEAMGSMQVLDSVFKRNQLLSALYVDGDVHIMHSSFVENSAPVRVALCPNLC